MTKLLQWVVVTGTVAVIWGAVLSQYWIALTENQEIQVLLFPVYLAGMFALYAATVIMWRVFTFNDCEMAASELRKEIQDAKADLRTRGFKMPGDEDDNEEDEG